MPAKRKSEVPAEPPSEKKKPKTPTTQRKRTVADAGVETSATASKRKKSIDKTAASSPVASTPAPKTPKQRRTSKKVAASADLSEAESVKKTTKKASKTETPKAEKKTPKATTRRKSVKEPIASPISSPIASSARGRSTSTAVPIKEAVGSVIATRATDQLQDEGEIVSLWNQSLATLYICLQIIGPPFAVVISLSYVMGKIHGNEAVASIGVVYLMLCLLILGSYAIAVLPLILISRIFTGLVAPHTGDYTEKQVNFYCRLLCLIVAVSIGVGVCALQ